MIQVEAQRLLFCFNHCHFRVKVLETFPTRAPELLAWFVNWITKLTSQHGISLFCWWNIRRKVNKVRSEIIADSTAYIQSIFESSLRSLPKFSIFSELHLHDVIIIASSCSSISFTQPPFSLSQLNIFLGFKTSQNLRQSYHHQESWNCLLWASNKPAIKILGKAALRSLWLIWDASKSHFKIAVNEWAHSIRQFTRWATASLIILVNKRRRQQVHMD